MKTSQLLYLSAGLFCFLSVAFGYIKKEACTTCHCYAYRKGFAVNCFNRSLYEMPIKIPENDTKLNLSSNYLSALSEDVFMMLPKLKVLDLSANSIMHISKGCFANNKMLEELVLSRNSLSYIPEDIFANNMKLKQLEISDNHLQELPKRLLFYNTDLRTILLSRNSLSYIPEDIFANNPKLKHLNISDNHLQELPERLLSNNTDLRTMNLSDNTIMNISKGCFANNKMLEKLLLNRNSLSHIPEDILANNLKLKHLDISDNHLQELPKRLLSYNTNLRTMDVSDNTITNISNGCFAHNKKLEELVLSRNSLSYIPEEIFAHNLKLKHLDLSANSIMNISKGCFANNELLEELLLSRNSLSYIPEDIVANNPKLKHLDISNNHLQELPKRLLSYNTDLRTILLNRNLLSCIPEDIFVNNLRLKHLDSSGNHLQELPKGLFFNNTDLRTLVLSWNSLSYIPEDIVSNNPKLKNLDISDNHLKGLPKRLLSYNTDLRTLKLSSNKLQELPPLFFKSSISLQDINLSKNNLSTISKSNFHGLRSVYTLIFDQNNLSTLPVDLFSEVSLDGIVFLSSNEIQEIPQKLFSSNKRPHNLSWLFLQKNDLTFLQDNTFKGLPNLTHLFLHGNNINSLGDDAFVGTGIQYIFLFSNKLDSLVNKPFSRISASLREVHLYKNNITIICDEVLPKNSTILTLFVDCSKLSRLPKLLGNINISCVKDSVLPDINITGRYKNSIRATLIEDAFECNTTTKIPNCSPCPTGTFGDGIKGCSPCPAGGYYQDEIGSTQCKKCQAGTFSRQNGSKSSDNCEVCPEGTNFKLFAGHRACFCKMDYARTDRFKGCSLCDKPGVNCSEDYQFICFGYYWNWSFTGANITAYTSFVSLIQNDSSEYNESNSRYLDKIPKAHHCPRRESCKNEGSITPDAIEGRCEEGYRGWLCSKCESRYYSILYFCIRCPDPVWIVLETVAILLLVFGLYILVKRQDNFTKKQTKKHRTLIDKISSQMKIVLGFYQVVGELFESFHDVNWVGPLQFMGELISFLKVNILRFIVRPHCLNEKFRVDVKLQMIISLIFPFGMAFFFIALYHLWKLVLKCRLRYPVTSQKVTLDNLKDKLLTYALLLLFITYPPTCDVIFKLYPGACKTFSIFESNNSINITLLRADYDIDCTTLKQYHVLAYVATITYVLAFPCALLFLLRKYCKKNLMASLGEGSQGSNSVNESVCLVKDKRQTLGEVPVWIKFLCENYKPKFWYWEIVELARKVTQTVLVTLLGWENVLTKLLTISISVLFLTLHAKLSPMTHNFEQRLQMFSLAAIFINVLVASVPIPEIYQAPVSTVLIILNMIIIVIIVGEVILITYRFIKKSFFNGRGI